MEIKGTALSGVRGKSSGELGIGSLVRVRVLERLDNRHLLISLRGIRHLARHLGPIPTKLFIAQVQRLKPRIELRFIKDLTKEEQPTNSRLLSELQGGKKSFIHRLFDTDNFLKALSVLVKGDRREIRRSFQRSIVNRGIGPSLRGKGDITGYLVLESLHNFLNPDSFYFLLPLQIGRRNSAAELKLACNREGMGDGFFLNIHLDGERRVAFLVFVDYDVINCTLSTNSQEIEKILKQNIDMLIRGLRSLKYDRKVLVNFTPYREEDFSHFNFLKTIDVKM